MSVRLVDHDLSSPVKALVDSGSEHVLAAPWLAADAGADLSSCKYEIDLGIGGANPTVKFVDMTLRLQHPGGNDDHYIEWECEVGFPSTWRPPWPVLLGQHGLRSTCTEAPDWSTSTNGTYSISATAQAASP